MESMNYPYSHMANTIQQGKVKEVVLMNSIELLRLLKEIAGVRQVEERLS